MAATLTTPAQFRRRTVARLVEQARDGLGRAHYERMRAGMHPEVALSPWEELTERTREAYRVKLDYLLPVVDDLVAGLVVQTDDRDRELIRLAAGS
jgi:hypothetical protein